jgi:hypothetical protein
MKTLRFLLAVISCLLPMRATSHAEEPKSASAGVDFHANKAVNDRTVHLRSSIALPLTKASLKNLRNRGPAIIGGPANKFRNTTALDGTGMKHKP